MSTTPQQHIIAAMLTRQGNARDLIREMRRLAGRGKMPRTDREMMSRVERAHGAVVRAAERVRGEQSEAALRLLDRALVSYQRRVVRLIVGGRANR